MISDKLLIPKASQQVQPNSVSQTVSFSSGSHSSLQKKTSKNSTPKNSFSLKEAEQDTSLAPDSQMFKREDHPPTGFKATADRADRRAFESSSSTGRFEERQHPSHLSELPRFGTGGQSNYQQQIGYRGDHLKSTYQPQPRLANTSGAQYGGDTYSSSNYALVDGRNFDSWGPPRDQVSKSPQPNRRQDEVVITVSGNGVRYPPQYQNATSSYSATAYDYQRTEKKPTRYIPEQSYNSPPSRTVETHEEVLKKWEEENRREASRNSSVKRQVIQRVRDFQFDTSLERSSKKLRKSYHTQDQPQDQRTQNDAPIAKDRPDTRPALNKLMFQGVMDLLLQLRSNPSEIDSRISLSQIKRQKIASKKNQRHDTDRDYEFASKVENELAERLIKQQLDEINQIANDQRYWSDADRAPPQQYPSYKHNQQNDRLVGSPGLSEDWYQREEIQNWQARRGEMRNEQEVRDAERLQIQKETRGTKDSAERLVVHLGDCEDQIKSREEVLWRKMEDHQGETVSGIVVQPNDRSGVYYGSYRNDLPDWKMNELSPMARADCSVASGDRRWNMKMYSPPRNVDSYNGYVQNDYRDYKLEEDSQYQLVREPQTVKKQSNSMMSTEVYSTPPSHHKPQHAENTRFEEEAWEPRREDPRAYPKLTPPRESGDQYNMNPNLRPTSSITPSNGIRADRGHPTTSQTSFNQRPVGFSHGYQQHADERKSPSIAQRSKPQGISKGDSRKQATISKLHQFDPDYQFLYKNVFRPAF